MSIRLGKIEELPSVKEGVSLFASREWASIYPACLSAYFFNGASGLPIWSFLFFQKSKYCAKYGITPPYAPHIGLHMKIEAVKTETIQSFKKKVHKEIASFIKGQNHALVEFNLSVDEEDSQPYTWEGFKVKPRHTYHLELAKSKEDLLSAMSPERRKNIKKALSDGLQVRKVIDGSTVLELFEKTISRQGIALDKSILNELLRADRLIDNKAIYICSYNGEDIAASLVVWDVERSYYLMGGYDPDSAHEGAGTLNLWTAIQEAKERGKTIFDFEGSMIPELERYFRGFGGELKTYFSIGKKNWIGEMATRVRR